MLESVGYEKVETVNSFCAILFQFEVGQLLTKLTPCLGTDERMRPVNKGEVSGVTIQWSGRFSITQYSVEYNCTEQLYTPMKLLCLLQMYLGKVYLN